MMRNIVVRNKKFSQKLLHFSPIKNEINVDQKLSGIKIIKIFMSKIIYRKLKVKIACN